MKDSLFYVFIFDTIGDRCIFCQARIAIRQRENFTETPEICETSGRSGSPNRPTPRWLHNNWGITAFLMVNGVSTNSTYAYIRGDSISTD